MITTTFLKFGILTIVATTLGACATTDSIKRPIKDQAGVTQFQCTDIRIHRTSADIRGGTVVINQGPVITTAPMSDYTPRMQAFIRACNTNHTIYAGHTQPNVNLTLGAGITQIEGAGSSVNKVYGSTAVAGATSGSNANAGAGAVAKK